MIECFKFGKARRKDGKARILKLVMGDASFIKWASNALDILSVRNEFRSEKFGQQNRKNFPKQISLRKGIMRSRIYMSCTKDVHVRRILYYASSKWYEMFWKYGWTRLVVFGRNFGNLINGTCVTWSTFGYVIVQFFAFLKNCRQ